MEEVVRLRMQPSSRLVLKALSTLRVADLNLIQRETGLPRRTVQSALRRLRDLDVISVQNCLSDSRRKFYCYSPNASAYHLLD